MGKLVDQHLGDTSFADTDLDGQGSSTVKRDRNGLPLAPQPTAFRDDPLNWSFWSKMLVTLQISWLAFLGPFASAVINPALVPLADAFQITTVEASYELTVYLVCAGVGPLFVAPLSNMYGRRPIYLLGNLLAAICNIVAGRSSTWVGILVTRAFCGIGAGCPLAIGAATICDLYCLHERGFYMGIYTFFLTNGPHVAPLIGGFLAQSLSWRWCFSIPGYIQLGTFVVTTFWLPETLYSRNQSINYKESSHWDRLLFKSSRNHARKIRLYDFVAPFCMLQYVSVAVPGLYYMTCFTYGSVLFAVTGSKLFTEFYHLDIAQTGLILSVPLLIGCLIGEANAGWVTDKMVLLHAKRHDGDLLPESRLNALWLALLIPVGIIIEGVCLTHYKATTWVGPAFGMGLACLGVQVATTVTYTYCTDCYKLQSSEISSIINVFRQVFAMTVSFYALPFGQTLEYEYAWLVFAMVNVALFIAMNILRVYGSRWRSSL